MRISPIREMNDRVLTFASRDGNLPHDFASVHRCYSAPRTVFGELPLETESACAKSVSQSRSSFVAAVVIVSDLFGDLPRNAVHTVLLNVYRATDASRVRHVVLLVSLVDVGLSRATDISADSCRDQARPPCKLHPANPAPYSGAPRTHSISNSSSLRQISPARKILLLAG